MEVNDFLPLSGLQHLIFCERQFALIHVEQLWSENALTTSGRVLHERTDLPGQTRSRDVKTVRACRFARNVFACRAVPMSSNSAERPGPTVWKSGGPSPSNTSSAVPRPEEPTKFSSAHRRSAWKKQLAWKSFSAPLLRKNPPPQGSRILTDVAGAGRGRREPRHELFDARHTPLATRHKGCDSCSLLDLCLPDVTGDRNRAHDVVDLTRFAQLQKDIP